MSDYVKEQRAYTAIAMTSELVAKRMRQATDREAATTLLVLAKMACDQCDRMDKAMDDMIAGGRGFEKMEEPNV